ncbi:MAG: hypothetical protein WBK08_15385 [Nitrospira sp.]
MGQGPELSYHLKGWLHSLKLAMRLLIAIPLGWWGFTTIWEILHGSAVEAIAVAVVRTTFHALLKVFQP